MSEKKERIKLWQEFKKFISKGNVIDMAVGVIMGSAFSAIVTAVTNILLSICTWGVPGGIAGLVTVLPAVNDTQKGYEALGLNASYSVSDWTSKVGTLDNFASIKDNYVLRGSTYYYKGLAVIDWGTLINAVITFLIISLFLFTVVKVFAYLQKKRDEIKAAELELYYQKHPEERPAPTPEAPKAPTEVELLSDIKALLEKQNGVKEDTKTE